MAHYSFTHLLFLDKLYTSDVLKDMIRKIKNIVHAVPFIFSVFVFYLFFFPFRNNKDEYKEEQLKEEKRKRAKYSKLIGCPCLNDYYN